MTTVAYDVSLEFRAEARKPPAGAGKRARRAFVAEVAAAVVNGTLTRALARSRAWRGAAVVRDETLAAVRATALVSNATLTASSSQPARTWRAYARRLPTDYVSRAVMLACPLPASGGTGGTFGGVRGRCVRRRRGGGPLFRSRRFGRLVRRGPVDRLSRSGRTRRSRRLVQKVTLR